MSEETPRLPDLEMIRKLGEGGMSSVWKAHDLKRGEIVAVKILNRDLIASPEDIALFMDEEKALETMSHQGIVKSYELACYGGRWYYIMEYVDGYNFGALLERKQHLQETDCLLICESVAVALDYAWNGFGVVHCDIKPENIMINTDGVVKLMDLGLCHTFKTKRDDGESDPDHIRGTPAYISPEQIYGDVQLDCRADIYSLAASIYHLATGRVLFPGLESESMMRAHCDEGTQAKDPRYYRPDLSEGFCRLLEAMLVKDRDYRIHSWGDVCRMCLDIEQGVAIAPFAFSGRSSVRLTDAMGGIRGTDRIAPEGAAGPVPRPVEEVMPRSYLAEPTAAAEAADGPDGGGRAAEPEPKPAAKKGVGKVMKMFLSKKGRTKLVKDPKTGRTVLNRPAATNPGFKVHRPAEW